MITLLPEIALVLVFIVAFLVTYLSIPSIVRLAQYKKFFDDPTHRKSHIRQIPTLGGVAIFAGFSIAAGSLIGFNFVPSLQYIMVACIIMFFIGVKDDIQVISPNKKLLGQIFAALILIIQGEIFFSNIHGFLGIYNITVVPSLFLTLFVIILIINSFNLIDGIDGLAASIGMLSTAFFGIWFFISGNIEYCLISAAMFGSLLAFFRFNVFGGKFKIFMGDTGSLVVGLIIAVQLILFNEKNIGDSSEIFAKIESAPAVSFSVLIFPLYDTLRVFIIRMSRGRSPFAADKNHLHHCILKLGFSHIQSTMLILLVNICFIAIALLLQNLGILFLMIIILSIATILSFYIEHIVRKKGMIEKPKLKPKLFKENENEPLK